MLFRSKNVKFYFDLTCQIEKKLRDYKAYDEFVHFFKKMEPKFLEYGFDLQEYKSYIDPSLNNKKDAIDYSILKTKIEMKFRDLPLLSSNFNHYLKNLEKLKVENDPYAVEFVREKYAQCDQIKRKSTFEIYNEALNLKSNLKIFKRRAKAFDDFNLFFVSANQEMINLYHKSLNQKKFDRYLDSKNRTVFEPNDYYKEKEIIENTLFEFRQKREELIIKTRVALKEQGLDFDEFLSVRKIEEKNLDIETLERIRTMMDFINQIKSYLLILEINYEYFISLKRKPLIEMTYKELSVMNQVLSQKAKQKMSEDTEEIGGPKR